MARSPYLLLLATLCACGSSTDVFPTSVSSSATSGTVGGSMATGSGGGGGADAVGGSHAGGAGGASSAFLWPISNSAAADADFVRHPYGPRWIGRYDFHAGIDINVAVGTPVHAIAGGTVVATREWDGTSAGAGTNLLVAHDDDRFSAYLHLSELRATVGDIVAQGDVVALSGDTGAKTPHLHLTCMVGLTGTSNDERRSVNPLAWLPHTERAPVVERVGDQWQVQLSAPHMRLARVVMQGGLETHDASYADIVAKGSTARDAEVHFGVGFAMDTGPDATGLFDLTLRPDPSEPNLTLQLFDIDDQIILQLP